ncbi:MAG TPA: sugar porter family MFS transporter [Steroidobacteraceae bacterium]|nr:sugar porter family MFS transporter [Steroidobacteraceae bacterium]
MDQGEANLSALPRAEPRGLGSLHLWLAATTSALGGFLFGYDWVVIGGAKPFYEAHFAITQPQVQAWVMSCALVGCLLGAIGSGPLSERIGRRPTLLISALAFAASAVGTGSAATLHEFVSWRIAGGVAIGMASVLSPIYIAEIAPAHIRGKLVCLNELTIVLGILAAQIVNWLIAEPIPATATLGDLQDTWNALYGWRRMFEAAVVPAVVFFIGLMFIPETPRWLAKRARWDRAHAVLASLGGSEYAAEVVSQMRSAFEEVAGNVAHTSRLTTRIRPVLIVGVTLAVLQQWCGINVIFNYAQEVFSAAGYALSGILFNIVITGLTMCVFTFVAIATVERLGRRALMLFGCGSLSIIYVLIGYCYHIHQGGILLLGLIVAAIASYAMTLAPITWVILSEIFPNAVRGTLMAICTASLWAACFVLTYSFPLLNASIGTSGTFWFYAAVCMAGFVFVFKCLPETKQQSLEAIQGLWRS